MTVYFTADNLSVRKEGQRWVLRRHMRLILWSYYWECCMYHATHDQAYKDYAAFTGEDAP